MMGEKVAYAPVSPHMYILSYMQVRRYPPLRQLHSDFGDFRTGDCRVMKITMDENNPDMGI